MVLVNESLMLLVHDPRDRHHVHQRPRRVRVPVQNSVAESVRGVFSDIGREDLGPSRVTVGEFGDVDDEGVNHGPLLFRIQLGLVNEVTNKAEVHNQRQDQPRQG